MSHTQLTVQNRGVVRSGLREFGSRNPRVRGRVVDCNSGGAVKTLAKAEAAHEPQFAVHHRACCTASVVHQGEVRLLSRSEEGALAYRGGAWVEITDGFGVRCAPGFSHCQSVRLG